MLIAWMSHRDCGILLRKHSIPFQLRYKSLLVLLIHDTFLSGISSVVRLDLLVLISPKARLVKC